MAMTGKQERNGVPGPEGDRVTEPSTDMTGAIQSLMRQAEAHGNARKVEAHNELLDTPAGSGSAGHEIGGGSNMFEWDSNLAVNELSGEA